MGVCPYPYQRFLVGACGSRTHLRHKCLTLGFEDRGGHRHLNRPRVYSPCGSGREALYHSRGFING